MDRNEAYWQADDRYIAQVNRQAGLVGKLTRVSPLASYVYVASALARTGVAESQKYRRDVVDWDRNIRRIANQQMEEYRRQIENYSAGKMPAPPKRPKGAYEWAGEAPFNYEGMRLSEVFGEIRVDIFMMLGLNVVFFMAAYLSFLRYDVR